MATVVPSAQGVGGEVINIIIYFKGYFTLLRMHQIN
jgi:hypothetical protein